jgi:uracil-DNA glycosylase
MRINEFIMSASEKLTPILNETGEILYSASRTLCEGKYYFLGLNPGGSGGRSVRESLRNLAEDSSNAYVDQAWENRRGKFCPGEHPLQKNAKHLFSVLETRIEDICSSNLIFSQSPGEKGAGYPEKAEVCWPVHELILGIVRPKTIITFGVKPFHFVITKLAAERLEDRRSGHGNWACREARTSQVRIIGLPHLSRYHLRGHNDVMSWIAGNG